MRATRQRDLRDIFGRAAAVAGRSIGSRDRWRHDRATGRRRRSRIVETLTARRPQGLRRPRRGVARRRRWRRRCCSRRASSSDRSTRSRSSSARSSPTTRVVSGTQSVRRPARRPADLRRACEVQARSHLLHLREGYIETRGRSDALAVAHCRGSAAPLAGAGQKRRAAARRARRDQRRGRGSRRAHGRARRRQPVDRHCARERAAADGRRGSPHVSGISRRRRASNRVRGFVEPFMSTPGRARPPLTTGPSRRWRSRAGWLAAALAVVLVVRGTLALARDGRRGRRRAAARAHPAGQRSRRRRRRRSRHGESIN